MTNFEDKIRKIMKEDVSLSARSEMKTNLMQSLHYKDSFWRQIRHAMVGLKLSVNSRVIMKEKLWAIVEGTPRFSFDWMTMRRGLSFATAFLFVFALVLQPFVFIDTVEASVFTRLGNYSGQVFVVRDGVQLVATKEMEIREGDVIKTGPASFAEVVVGDESIVRLAGGSEVVFKDFIDSEGEDSIKIKVNAGEVWNNVKDLDFKFSAQKLNGEVKNSGTLDIAVRDSFTRVVSLKRSVSLLLSHDGQIVPANLVKGQDRKSVV